MPYIPKTGKPYDPESFALGARLIERRAIEQSRNEERLKSIGWDGDLLSRLATDYERRMEDARKQEGLVSDTGEKEGSQDILVEGI